jgi:hypothetical protein
VPARGGRPPAGTPAEPHRRTTPIDIGDSAAGDPGESPATSQASAAGQRNPQAVWIPSRPPFRRVVDRDIVLRAAARYAATPRGDERRDRMPVWRGLLGASPATGSGSRAGALLANSRCVAVCGSTLAFMRPRVSQRAVRIAPGSANLQRTGLVRRMVSGRVPDSAAAAGAVGGGSACGRRQER